MNKIVVFASGSGSNFQAIIDAINTGQIRAEISGLIAGKPGIKAIERANNANIPIATLQPSAFPSDSDFTKALLEKLKEWDPKLIVLAGYLQKIPSEVIREYQGSIINIHPSLLPKYGGKGFYGLVVHKAVIDAGDEKSGCTIHMVTENYDEGPFLDRVEIDVLPDDTPETLAARVLEQEHRLLPEVIAKIINPKVI